MPELYIGIGTVGGIITYIYVSEDIEDVKENLEEAYYNSHSDLYDFNPECDDARIFNSAREEVFCMFSERPREERLI